MLPSNSTPFPLPWLLPFPESLVTQKYPKDVYKICYGKQQRSFVKIKCTKPVLYHDMTCLVSSKSLKNTIIAVLAVYQWIK